MRWKAPRSTPAAATRTSTSSAFGRGVATLFWFPFLLWRLRTNPPDRQIWRHALLPALVNVLGQIGWAVAADVQPYTYSVGLHVDDAEGNFVAQVDYGLPELAFACQETQIPVSDLPPGEYTLYVIVYAWESGQRLQGDLLADRQRGERLPLGTFSVQRH